MPYQGSGNPYQDLLAESVEKTGVKVENLPRGMKPLIKLAFGRSPSVIHVHWLDDYLFRKSLVSTVLKSLLTGFCFLLLKLRGRRFVWTLHNLHNHENAYPKVERWFMRFFLRLVDGVISHCEYAKGALAEKYGVRLLEKTFVIPHGNYPSSVVAPNQRHQIRDELGLDSTSVLFLFVGQVRPYKGILGLIDQFKELEDSRARLMIVGKVRNEAHAEVIDSRIERDGRIQFHPGRVEQARLDEYLCAADVFVAPFTEVLTSGSVILAISNGLPCIVPSLGCLPETLQTQPELVYQSDLPDDLGQKLQYAIDHSEDLAAIGESNYRYARDSLGWEAIGQKTAALYRSSPIPNT
ncbi:MAG: glycosyltransferase family 4 protein [Lacipirellulaceae bacterium]